jgi:hypothetical protein
MKDWVYFLNEQHWDRLLYPLNSGQYEKQSPVSRWEIVHWIGNVIANAILIAMNCIIIECVFNVSLAG